MDDSQNGKHGVVFELITGFKFRVLLYVRSKIITLRLNHANCQFVEILNWHMLDMCGRLCDMVWPDLMIESLMDQACLIRLSAPLEKVHKIRNYSCVVPWQVHILACFHILGGLCANYYLKYANHDCTVFIVNYSS